MKLRFTSRSTLDKRLRRVDREISEVSSSINSLTRKARKEGMELAPRRAGRSEYRGPSVIEGPGRGAVPDDAAGALRQARPEAVEPRRVANGNGDDAGVGNGGPRAPRGKLPVRQQTDEQFATYFMTGSLERDGTLRQERHVQRNKALFMLFVLLLVLFAVLFFATR